MENNGQSDIVAFCCVFRSLWQINSTASWPTVGGGAVKKSSSTFYFVPVCMSKSKQRFMFIPSPATCFAHVSCQKIPCGSQKGFIEMTNIQETTPDWGDRWNSKLRMNEVDDFTTIWWQQFQQSQINSAIFFHNFVCWMSLPAASMGEGSVEIFAFCST